MQQIWSAICSEYVSLIPLFARVKFLGTLTNGKIERDEALIKSDEGGMLQLIQQTSECYERKSKYLFKNSLKN